ncbi:LacI family DNA-binding transcriptional regulator [Herbidospora daliensis]|uniref:LacI family DNA-binding transcriptional regulator n=1 Tax=Herbidospora daliensis TaxID=295585 RepID=UPI000782A044|nr:LacI family DNA-binding transcriptional regulator [Herbidospora daliensis]
MTVTIKDVARLAGVSPSSVCRALADPGQVRPGTRERVLAAARELAYSPNRAARSLSTGRTGNIGVVLPDMANPVFPGIVKAVQTQARKADHAVFLSDVEEDPALEVHMIRTLAKQVDGFLLCSPRSSDGHLRSFADQTPIVVLNRRVGRVPSVTADNADGMLQAVTHLHALGHRRLAYVAGPRTSWSNRERTRSLRQAAASFGIELVETGHVPPELEGGVAIADVVVASGATAAVTYNDLIALGMLNRLHARGIGVPGEMSVVGFDGILMSGLVSPALTTVAVPMEQLGRVGVDLLLELLAGRRTGSIRRVLPTRLLVRASTGPAPHR